MPRSYNTEDVGRDTVDLHASWWSSKKDENGRYLERCVVYAERFHADDEWVNKQVFGTMKAPTKAGQVIDTSMTAKSPTYLIQRMVVELTDEDGRPAPMGLTNGGRAMLSEKFIRGFLKRDTDFIIEQLDAMKEPPVPVTEADHVEAEALAATRTDLLNRGFPAGHPSLPPEREVEELAQDHFRPTRPVHFSQSSTD